MPSAQLHIYTLQNHCFSRTQLFPSPRGSLLNLTPRALDPEHMRRRLAPDQALLSVAAIGLNMRDILNVLGSYPGDPGPPGSDCAAVVACAAPAALPSLADGGAVELRAGQRAFGLAHGCLGSCVTTEAAQLAPLPPHVSPAQAAALPTVCMTAQARVGRLSTLIMICQLRKPCSTVYH